jgi:hypothetical protein
MTIENVRENELKTVSFVQNMILVWHKHHYLRYRYYEIGCMNEKVKTDLRKRKMYHYKKYMNVL